MSRSRRRASRNSSERYRNKGKEPERLKRSPGTPRRSRGPAGRGSFPPGLVLAALAADSGHPVAVLARGLAALPTGCARLFGWELMRRAFLVRRFAALAPRLPRFLGAEFVGRTLYVG